MAKPQDIKTSTPQTVTGGQSGVVIDGSTIDPNTNLPIGTEVFGPINFDSDIHVDANIYANYIFGTILANVSNAAYANVAGVANIVTGNIQTNINKVGPLIDLNVVNDISVTGNISTTYIFGNGKYLTDIEANSAFSNTANYVVQNNQPNITSLGSLTSLDVSGTVNSNLVSNDSTYNLGNTNNRWNSLWVNNIYSNNQSITSNNTGFILSGNTYASLVGNVSGTATTALNVLNNSQPNITSVGTLSGLNVNGNVSATGNVTGQYILGNGFYLTDINVPVANYSNYSGVADVSNIAYSVSLSNVVGIGNIASLNLDGNVSNILHGDGSWGPESQDTNANYANFAGTAFSVSGSNVVGQVGSANLANIANIAYSVNASNVVGTVANANYSNYAATAYNVTGSNVVGAVSLALLANVANVAYSVSGSNVSGIVANANYSNVSGTSYSVNVGNVVGIGNVATLNLSGNSQTLLDGSGNFVAIPSTANSNYANYAGTAYSVNASNVVGIVGNATHSNISDVANVAYSVNASNVVGQVGNSLVAGTVYGNVQSNITQVGTLSGLNINGNVSIVGDVNVTGNVNYSNVTELVVGDPLIFIGSNNTGNLYDLGLVAQYDDTSLKYTGLARNHNNGVWTFYDTLTTYPTTQIDWNNVTYPNVRTGNLQSGNVNANYFIGNGSTLTSLTGSNVTGTVANATYATNAGSATTATSATTAGTVTTNAQPNITSVGTLSSLSATGNITGNYIIGNGALLTNIPAANVVGNLPVRFDVKNVSAGTLVKGTPIYISGSVGASGVVEVQASRADTPSTMGCVGMLEQDLVTNAFGTAISIGQLTSLNTIAYSVGDTIYVAPTGGITNVRPNDGYLVQPIGTVSRSNASTGIYEVNIWDILDLPNLNNGNIWVGTVGNGSPVQTPLSSANVGNATFATTSGLSNIANIAYSVNVGNVVGIGNIATLNLNGNGNTYLLGNGTFGVVPNTANSNYANFAGTAFSVSGSNVVGAVATATSATTAGTVTFASQPNITSVGTLSSLSATGNITGQYILGNGAFLTGISGGGNTANSNYANFAGTAFNVSGSNVVGSVANANVANAIIVGNSIVNINSSGNVRLATQNSVDTSLINLATLDFEGRFSVIRQSDSTDSRKSLLFLQQYANTAYGTRIGSRFARGNVNAPLSVQPNDIIINLNGSPYNGANYMDEIGTTYISTISAFVPSTYVANVANVPMSWRIQTVGDNQERYLSYFHSNGTFEANGNIISSGNISVTGNIEGNYFVGNGSLLTDISVSNVSNSNYSNFAGTAFSVSGSNVVGTVANATYATNAGSATTADTVTTASQPNITSVGTLTSLSVSGNIDVGNLNLTGNIVDSGALSIITGSNGNINLRPNGTGIVIANSAMSVTGNITAPFFIGNGSQLTGISAGTPTSIVNGNSNITIPVANSTILYFNTAGSNAFTMTRTSGGGTLGFVQDGSAGITLESGKIAIGRSTVLGSTYSTAIGYNIPAIGAFAVAIGSSPKGSDWSVSVGTDSGGGQDTVSLGGGAGRDAATGAIAVGRQSANSAAKANSISIGYQAGYSNIGVSAIAIGARAGNLNQANNSIVINATGANLTTTVANTFIVKPIRANITGNAVYYNTTSGEISYGLPTLPSYTIAGKPASGAIGQMIALSDATPGGRLAFWDTTNTRWSYVNDNSAV